MASSAGGTRNLVAFANRATWLGAFALAALKKLALEDLNL
jgi:hypothetical protein